MVTDTTQEPWENMKSTIQIYDTILEIKKFKIFLKWTLKNNPEGKRAQ